MVSSPVQNTPVHLGSWSSRASTGKPSFIEYDMPGYGPVGGSVKSIFDIISMPSVKHKIKGFEVEK